MVGGDATGIAFDLSEPTTIARRTGRSSARSAASCSPPSIATTNTVADYDIAKAIRLVTLKLVGYTEVVHTLRDRLTDGRVDRAVRRMAKERPYPGSTTVTTVNGGVVGLTRTLVEELKPLRVNAIHPGVVGDSPYWAEKPAAVAKYTSETPTGRLASMVGHRRSGHVPAREPVGQWRRPHRRRRLALPVMSSREAGPCSSSSGRLGRRDPWAPEVEG